MNSRFIFPTLAAALLASAPLVRAGPLVTVSGTVTDSPSALILDLTADTGGADLRGFGIRVTYNDGAITPRTAGSYDGLWFLRGSGGANLPYTDFRAPVSGAIIVIGGRFDGTRPANGVAGQGVLLATLVFKRISTEPAKIGLALAEPKPFTNFATAGGESLDANVVFTAIQTVAASEDTDGDQLPDNYELATFGKLGVSNGTTDTDHDGESDLDEFTHGTNPKDPASNSAFKLVIQPDGTKLLQWQGALERVYDILWTPDLGPFQTLHAGIPGADMQLQRIDDFHGYGPRGFYRLRTHFPTAGR
jgi:hypothetical protein